MKISFLSLWFILELTSCTFNQGISFLLRLTLGRLFKFSDVKLFVNNLLLVMSLNFSQGRWIYLFQNLFTNSFTLVSLLCELIDGIFDVLNLNIFATKGHSAYIFN